MELFIRELERLLLEELKQDYSWRYITKDSQDDIIYSHICKIAEWLIIKTKSFRQNKSE